MLTNYHAHTKWCRHASCEVEELIVTAIEKGYEEFAITEHIPFPTIRENRMLVEEIDEFIGQIDTVTKKYADKIKVLKGLECEYYPQYHDYYIDLKNKYNLDFLIVGQHYSTIEEKIDFFNISLDSEILLYEECLFKAMKSNLFAFVAHPDVYLNGSSFNKQAKKTANNIFKLAEELNMPLEININGLRLGKGYPCKEFWKESKKYNLTYIINVDSHSLAALDHKSIKETYAMADELNIKITEFLKF